MVKSLYLSISMFVVALFFIPFHLKRKVDTLEQTLLENQTLVNLSSAILLRWHNDFASSIYYVSQNIHQLIGCTKQELESKALSVLQDMQDAIEKKLLTFTHKPYRVVTKTNSIKWVQNHTLLLRDANDNIVSFVGYLTDITELKNSELRLKHLSQTDQLTKIPNRMYIDAQLQKQDYYFRRNAEACSILLIDIDFFKSVNDTYGHILGDAVLVEFAQLLKNSIRKGDHLGRWGGEEFLIVLPHTDIAKATALAHKLRAIIYEHRFCVVEHISASFGVSSLVDKLSITELIDAADKALYTSKAKGRNCVTYA
jgi:diguanylate cyclase (GGDEF)-like protein/PAS domain S-box-containing protein